MILPKLKCIDRPEALTMHFIPTGLKRWLGLTVSSFLVLLLLLLASPALFLLLQLPSFTLGESSWQWLAWKNDETGTGIQFNLIPPLILALILGSFSYGLMSYRRRRNRG